MSLPRPRITALVLASGCGLLIGACGSSSHSLASEQAGSNQAVSLVRFSECMRSRGVSGFPDPSTGGQGPNSFGIDGFNFNLPAGLSTQSPAYVSADKTCGRFIGSGSGPALNPKLLARARQQQLERAECMRTHGVPDFPDPTVTGDGGGISVSSGGGGFNPRSPAFQQAQKICQGR